MSATVSRALASASREVADHHVDGAGEDGLAVGDDHLRFLDRQIGGERPTAAAGRDADEPVAAAVGGELGTEDAVAGPVGGSDDDRAGGVGEQDAASPLGRIDSPREDVGGDDQHRGAVRANEAVGEGERIEEAGAGAGEVDAARVAETEAMGEQRRRRRQQVIGRARRQQRKRDVGAARGRIAAAPYRPPARRCRSAPRHRQRSGAPRCRCGGRSIPAPAQGAFRSRHWRPGAAARSGHTRGCVDPLMRRAPVRRGPRRLPHRSGRARRP